MATPPPADNPRRAELLAALRPLGLEENRDFWLVHNGTDWRLRWFDHTTAEQHVASDELVNRLLNSQQPQQ